MHINVFNFDCFAKPVSYTHLDVYKRQGFLSLELTDSPGGIASEVGNEGLKPSVFLRVLARQLLNGFGFGLPGQSGDHLADRCIRLACGFREDDGCLLAQLMDFC